MVPRYRLARAAPDLPKRILDRTAELIVDREHRDDIGVIAISVAADSESGLLPDSLARHLGVGTYQVSGGVRIRRQAPRTSPGSDHCHVAAAGRTPPTTSGSTPARVTPRTSIACSTAPYLGLLGVYRLAPRPSRPRPIRGCKPLASQRVASSLPSPAPRPTFALFANNLPVNTCRLPPTAVHLLCKHFKLLPNAHCTYPPPIPVQFLLTSHPSSPCLQCHRRLHCMHCWN